MLVWGYPYLGNNLHINSLRNWYPKKTQFSGRIWRRSCLDPCGQGTTKEFTNHMIGKGDSLLIMGYFIHWIWLLPTKSWRFCAAFPLGHPQIGGENTPLPLQICQHRPSMVPNMCKSPTELLNHTKPWFRVSNVGILRGNSAGNHGVKVEEDFSPWPSPCSVPILDGQYPSIELEKIGMCLKEF